MNQLLILKTVSIIASFKVFQIFLIIGGVSSASLSTTNSTETTRQAGQSWKKSLSKAIQELTALLEKMYEETTGKYIHVCGSKFASTRSYNIYMLQYIHLASHNNIKL
jgi:hypothetical protein